MTDFADTLIAVEDAIGPDYIELAPEGEAHFDPFTVATLLACHILYAVGAGVKEGIQEAAKDGTVAVLQASGRHISERLVPKRLREFFTKENTPAERAAAQQQASTSLADAATAAGQLDPEKIAQIASAAAVAVADALRTAGLKDTGTQRVAQTIEAQVKITLTPVS
jgi:hypothetical protein